MAIKVLRNFGGVETSEKRILPGVYEDGAPELLGIEDLLIERGIAIRADPVNEVLWAIPDVPMDGGATPALSPIADNADSDQALAATSIHHLGLSGPALKALTEAGIQTAQSLLALSDEELQVFPGVGQATIAKIRKLDS